MNEVIAFIINVVFSFIRPIKVVRCHGFTALFPDEDTL